MCAVVKNVLVVVPKHWWTSYFKNFQFSGDSIHKFLWKPWWLVSNSVVIPIFSWRKKFYKVLRLTIRANEFHILSSFHFFFTPAMSRVIYRHYKNLGERSKIGKHFSKVFHISSEISPVLHLLTTMVKVVMVKSLIVEQPSSFLRKIFAPHSFRETSLAREQSSIFLLLSFHNSLLLEALFVGYVCIFGVPLKSHES